jgi:hypothetical protein
MTKPLHLLYTFKPKGESINNSGLSDIKRVLLGLPGFWGGEIFLQVGSEIHKRAMEPDKKIKVFDSVYEPVIRGCTMSLHGNKEFKDMLRGASVEILCRNTIHGVYMHGTLDMRNLKGSRKGGDIKTTSSRSYKEIIYSMVKYGYFRQARVYMLLEELEEFKFFFVQKFPPYCVYVVNVADYKQEMKYADNELKFLLKFYDKYGIPVKP